MQRWPLNRSSPWERAPFIRLLPPLVAGIVCYDHGWPSSHHINLVIAVALSLILVLQITLPVTRHPSATAILRAAVLHILLFSAGWGSYYLNDVRNDPSWYGNHLTHKEAFAVRIAAPPSEKPKTWKVPVEITAAIAGSTTERCRGSAMVYLYKSGRELSLQKGDRLLIPGNWQAIHNAGNPCEFDYKRFANRADFYHQQFLSINDVQILPRQGSQPFSLITYCHDEGMKSLARYLKNPHVLGLIQAMLIGDDVHLDTETLQSYTDTGIVHIIAISGSHIAVLFLFVSGCFFWLPHKKYRWVRYLCAVPLAWFYVLIAGAPSSAVRAAVMFSLLGLGLILEKDRNSLNQLFAASFVMLVYYPSWLFAIGFQLSFLAVLSLVLFYQKIFASVRPKNIVLQKAWMAVSASLAAEILVAPLVIYYFHLLPAGFLAANILAWLFMGIVLLMGIAIIAFARLAIIAKGIAWLLTTIVTAFSVLIAHLQSSNPEALGHLNLSFAELSIVYLAIAAFAGFVMVKRKQYLITSLVCICALLISSICKEWEHLHQEKLIVYNVSGVNQVEKIEGKWFQTLLTDTGSQYKKKIEYATGETHTILAAWQQSRRKTTQELFQIGNKTLLVLDEPPSSSFKDPFPVNYVLINYPVNRWNAPQIIDQFHCEKIVIGSNQKTYLAQAWKDRALRQGIPMHVATFDGAFVMGN